MIKWKKKQIEIKSWKELGSFLETFDCEWKRLKNLKVWAIGTKDGKFESIDFEYKEKKDEQPHDGGKDV